MRTLRVVPVLFIFGLLLLGIACSGEKSYAENFQDNWGIDLHTNAVPVYHAQRDVGLQGDGQRYTVYEYESFDVLADTVEWERGPGATAEDTVAAILAASEFDVPGQFLPDWNAPCHVYQTTREDGATLCMVYGTDANKLYIAEIFV